MKKQINMALTFLLIIFLISCSETSSPYQSDNSIDEDGENIVIEEILSNPIVMDGDTVEIDENTAVVIVLKIIPGQLVHKAKEKYRGRWVWKVKVKTTGNGKVEVKIDIKTGKVLKIEGEEGHYDYDIKTLEKFLKLQQALELALKEVNGVIVKWELKYDSDYSWKFEIKIQTETGLMKIEIKAEGGLVIEIKKEESEDDDDDGDDDYDDGDDDDDDGDSDTTSTDSSRFKGNGSLIK